MAAAVLAACGPLGDAVWAADVVNLFRPYAVVATAGVFLLCVASRRMVLGWLGALCLVLELALLAAPAMAGLGLPHGSAGPSRVIEVITFNCLGSNPEVGPATAWIRRMRPDILALEETPYDWAGGLAGLSDVLPYRASWLEPAYSDVEVFSRAPMRTADTFRPTFDGRRVVHATVQMTSGPLQVFALHPATLRRPWEWRLRNAGLQLAGQWIGQWTGRRTADGRASPTLVLGDWNTPPWSPAFTRFARLAGVRLADPLVWPPVTRVLASPGGIRLGSSIDHVAASGGISVIRCETGPQLGSDHAPLVCWLRLPPG